MRELTSREREVVVLRCDGLTVHQIAGQLGRSESTVDRTLEKAMRKAGVSNAVMLLRWALEHDLVAVPSRPPHSAPAAGGLAGVVGMHVAPGPLANQIASPLVGGG